MTALEPIESVAERRRRQRRVWLAGLLVSAVVHVLVLALWPIQTILISPFSAAGERARDFRAAASGAMQSVNVRVATPVPVVPVPMPVPIEIEVEPVEIFEEPPVIVEAPEPGIGEGLQGPGTLEGPGTTDGSGRGDGGTADEGLFRLIPAAPRAMIIPPTSRRLQGQEVEVWVFVDEDGRVVSDSTRLRPPTSDAAFNRQLIREAAEWVFRPATQGGKAIASWFPYRITM